MKIKRFSTKKIISIYIVSFLVTITASVVIAMYFSYTVKRHNEAGGEKYDAYYVMITPYRDQDFWKSVYKGAFDEGKEKGIMVETLGDNLSEEYSVAELMEIAIASKVDGIIVHADDTEEVTGLINKAVSKNIPVVTVYGDSTQSERCCFVGVGSYNLGREYGKQIIKIARENESLNTTVSTHMNDTLDVKVLIDSSADNWNQNIVWSGIKDAVSGDTTTQTKINLSMVYVDNRNNFTSEESIRDIFNGEEIPDVIVCLNETNTSSVYKAVVDYNSVGRTNILGYFVSDSILKGISRNVIYSTMSVDTVEMGSLCVDALYEYKNTGNTNQFTLADITLIDRSNVEEYLEDTEVEAE